MKISPTITFIEKKKREIDQVFYDVCITKYGEVTVAWDTDGVLALYPLDIQQSAYDLKQEFPDAVITRDQSMNHEALLNFFSGNVPDTENTIRVVLTGTPFQNNALKQLIKIPRGKMASYQDIARLAGNARATRAAASAIGTNNHALLIPCHRVIRSDGLIGKYRWGAELKKKLLDSEK